MVTFPKPYYIQRHQINIPLTKQKISRESSQRKFTKIHESSSTIHTKTLSHFCNRINSSGFNHLPTGSSLSYKYTYIYYYYTHKLSLYSPSCFEVSKEQWKDIIIITSHQIINNNSSSNSLLIRMRLWQSMSYTRRYQTPS